MPATTPQWRSEATAVELRARAADMRSDWREITKGGTRDSDEFRSREVQFLEEIADIDHHLTLSDMAEQRSSFQREAPEGALNDPAPVEYRSAGQIVANDEGFRSWAATQTSRAHLTGESPNIEFRTLVTGGSFGTSSTVGGTYADTLSPQLQPSLVNTFQQRLFIRDLLSVQTTTAPSVPYYREKNVMTNAADFGASTVAEGGLKPEGKIEFEPDHAVVQVIAVNVPVTTQALDDVPALQALIDNRLVYMLKYREEQQILHGSGVSPNLKGIYEYDIQTQAATANDPAVTIGNAISKIEEVYGDVDAIVMRPADAWAMFIKRAAGGSGTFDAGTPFSTLPINVWGFRVVRSVGQTSGHALVGSFRLGATLLDRQQANVRVYEQHGEFAIYNKVLVQAEERVGLQVNNESFFCDATL